MSIALRYAICKALRCAMPGMKTVEEVRRERLAELRKEVGSLVAMNERLGLTSRDSTLSQLANGAKNSKTGKPKEMGSRLARELETAFKKPVGWMDTDPALSDGMAFAPEVAAVATDMESLSPQARKWVLDVVRDTIRSAREVFPTESGVEPKEAEEPSHREPTSAIGRRAA